MSKFTLTALPQPECDTLDPLSELLRSNMAAGGAEI
jgi:hypothetical protein